MAAERNYPVYDKELLAMKYALVKLRVHLLGTRPFVIFTNHASLRTTTNSPHLSQRMARWLSFFAEYNFLVEYKPGKLNVLADVLSRRPDYELAHVSRVTTDLYDRIRLAPGEDLPSRLSDIWWTRMYKWVVHYVKTCETCQRLKPSGHALAPLQSLPVPADCWKSMSLDFVFGPTADENGNTGILVFVCR
ncbi:Inositol-3-phosphate synthase [Phytophthora palmivora]|uniref:Inositol-3-phosphate synthase n=1 Tax=Phytophthora palmivora TaxID=4796 RepID=A0A2P4XW49_9STRA|nr:Inositol-3-phosphate synthase [Phytophthora palmivora]